MSELPFKSEEFKTAWEEWEQYRKERKLPSYKPTGLKKTFAMLLRISGNDGDTAIKIINQSIEQNWQGLFEIKSSLNIKKELQNGSTIIRNINQKIGTSEARRTGLQNF